MWNVLRTFRGEPSVKNTMYLLNAKGNTAHKLNFIERSNCLDDLIDLDVYLIFCDAMSLFFSLAHQICQISFAQV